MWQMLWNYQPALLGLRFIVSFLILLVPTTAMGLTLPVLIEDPMLRQTNFGRAIGFLYGSNTLGAVAGAVLGEGYLIAALGLRGTSLAAGAASCVAAGMALFVAKFEGETGARLLQRTFPLRVDARYRPPWGLLLISFGTGSVLLALEVIWFRFLRLYVASSPTAFAIMLAVVLAGIGFGGVAAGAIHHRSRPLNRLLPLLLVLAALATLLSYLFFPGELIQARAGVFDLRWWQIALLSTALMFPVALISGVLFPSIATSVQASVGDRMNSTGITTLANTTGAAFGPLIASFVLLPGVGYQWSLIFCAAGYAALSAVAAMSSFQPSLKSGRRGDTDSSRGELSEQLNLSGLVLIGLWAALILVLAIFPYGHAQTHFEHVSRPYRVDDQGHLLARVVKRIEGPSETYQLLRYDLFGQPYYYQLLTSGFSMSGTSPQSQRYMRLFAYLPLAFRPESTDVLLICYGCGVTADAFVHESRLKEIDVVDISKEVFALANLYLGINYSNPLHDPRVQAVVQDGRFFLQASPRQYDIISGEPPPPKVAGSVNLYTQEFFSLMNDRLKEGGIATFWLPINQLKVDEAKAIVRAFHNVFPNASLWASADEQWIMMGIKGQGRAITENEIGRLWSDPIISADLNRIGIEVPQQLGALFLLDGEGIGRATRDVAPLTDFYPKRLSDAAWDEQASHRFALSYMDAPAALRRFLESPLIGRIWPERQDESLKSCFIFREARYRCGIAERCNTLAELDVYLRHSPLRTPVLEVLGSDEFRLAIAERIAGRTETPPAQIKPDLIAGALARRDIDGAIRLLESEKDRGTSSLNDTFLLTYLYCLNGDVEKAETLVASDAASIKRNWFVDWLWEKLETDFGFHPPTDPE
jgi:spermidine synthase